MKRGILLIIAGGLLTLSQLALLGIAIADNVGGLSYQFNLGAWLTLGIFLIGEGVARVRKSK